MPARGLESTRLRGGRRQRITRSAVLSGGRVLIPAKGENAALEIAADGIVVDLSGLVLDGGRRPPEEREGIGILVDGRKNVILRNARVRGYKYNVVLRRCTNVLVVDGDLSGSRAARIHGRRRYDPRDWLDIFRPKIWRGYGAAIVLDGCRRCRVQGVRAGGAQNGAMLVATRESVVSGCDFSRNSGWGIWMWRSGWNQVLHNNCSRCVRCEDPKRFSAGGDSAGIILSQDNHQNIIAYNDLRRSGDGFFLNGLRVKPSGDNTVAFNDASHSPHNAFESSFSPRNRFIGNVASNSRFGFWAGYSTENEFIGNIVEHCLQWGIAIEHGQGNAIVGNEIRNCERGIVLFERKPGARRSSGYEIHGNVIEDCRVGVTLSQTEDVSLVGNAILRGGVAVETAKGSSRLRVALNNLSAADAAVHLEDPREIELHDNFYGTRSRDEVLDRIRLAGGDPCEIHLGPVAPAPLPLPDRPVVPQIADPKARRDRRFRWYKGRKALVGTAEY